MIDEYLERGCTRLACEMIALGGLESGYPEAIAQDDLEYEMVYGHPLENVYKSSIVVKSDSMGILARIKKLLKKIIG